MVELAQTYSPKTSYPVSQWWSSPKMDGIRALYTPTNGLVSRSGKSIYVGLDHIESICLGISESLQHKYILDGELYIPNMAFPTASGIIRDKKNYDLAQKALVQFHLFALAPHQESDAWPNTAAMVNQISSLVTANSSVLAIPYTLIDNSPSSVFAQNESNKVVSLEGTMLRHPDIAYTNGRTRNLLKVKNMFEAAFTITAIHKGTGKLSKTMGAVSVIGTFEGQEVETKIGSGFSNEERLIVWENQTVYLSSQVQVIFMGLSSSSRPAKSLRNPVFKQFIT